MIYLYLIASVLVSVLFVSIGHPKKMFIQCLLSFSGAYLLSMTISHLLPESFGMLNSNQHTHNTEPTNIKLIAAFILLGIIIQLVLESFSKGAEHGHVHIHDQKKQFPWLLFVSLCLHAFSEGIPLGYVNNEAFLWAIVIHKVPVGIVLTSFFLKHKYEIKKVIFFMSAFALMSPIGSFLASKIHFFQDYQNYITAIIIGIFLHISTVILFESSENHKFSFPKFIAILLGMGVALL
ncbi:ZIP family metal transporter [Wenyingzhuangia sp. 2_MG-2023]|uniref:ZIP family metal transporter n=1 Tax=Wenyingzhuangia sp. 2_MG-2023 TaxID=3062639 RepID=UPI0026E1B356|nr:ZIP family metal transporter [Wenyingzhuangia sp. 2_MG-2023]MDO6738533.1 ZIP family metal transporter [Wenyingzhuangia sp. 2_MG-2023]MDO6803244.1 ZIP family metal transporter [Wenyingzhuangia sp. 1_MG-2023]